MMPHLIIRIECLMIPNQREQGIKKGKTNTTINSLEILVWQIDTLQTAKTAVAPEIDIALMAIHRLIPILQLF